MSEGKTRFDVLVSREAADGKRFFTKIGAAFVNRDGSIGVVLDALPKDGNLLLKQPLDRDDRDPRGERSGGAPPGRSEGRKPGPDARRQGQGNQNRYRQGGAAPQQSFQKPGAAYPEPTSRPADEGGFCDDQGDADPF